MSKNRPSRQNRSHLRPNSPFMLKVREEREIGIDPVYLHAAARRRLDITPAEWRRKQASWRVANAPKVEGARRPDQSLVKDRRRKRAVLMDRAGRRNAARKFRVDTGCTWVQAWRTARRGLEAAGS